MPEPYIHNYPSGIWSYSKKQLQEYGDAREAAGYEAGLAAGKKDAEEFGNALNEAGWAFVESYGKRLGGGMSGHFFNTVKPILRDAILAYFAALQTEPPK